MALLYSMSSNQDDQREEAAAFLSGRWAEVLEDEVVAALREALSSSSWTAENFEVEDVVIGDDVRIRFTFEAKGLDSKSKPSGDRISGSAVAVVNEYDHVGFTNVTLD